MLRGDHGHPLRQAAARPGRLRKPPAPHHRSSRRGRAILDGAPRPLKASAASGATQPAAPPPSTHGVGPGLLLARQSSIPSAAQAAVRPQPLRTVRQSLSDSSFHPQGHLPPVTPDDDDELDEELESFRSDDDGSAAIPELEVCRDRGPYHPTHPPNLPNLTQPSQPCILHSYKPSPYSTLALRSRAPLRGPYP